MLLETRKFIVNRYVPDTFEKKLEFDGKSYGPGESVQARIEVSRTAGGPMKDAKANVVAASNGKTFHEQKDAKFTTVTDAGGTKVFLDVRLRTAPRCLHELEEGLAAVGDAEREHPGRERRRGHRATDPACHEEPARRVLP